MTDKKPVVKKKAKKKITKPDSKTVTAKSEIVKAEADQADELVTLSKGTIKIMQENIIIHDILLRTLLTTDKDSVDFIMADFLANLNFEFVVAAQGLNKEFENRKEVLLHACNMMTVKIVAMVNELNKD